MQQLLVQRACIEPQGINRHVDKGKTNSNQRREPDKGIAPRRHYCQG